MDRPITWLEIVNTSGIIGLLILFLTLFLKGDILPRKIHEEIVNHYKSLSDDIVNRLEQLTELLSKHDRDSVHNPGRFSLFAAVTQRSRGNLWLRPRSTADPQR
jgi:hypothetical protein